MKILRYIKLFIESYISCHLFYMGSKLLFEPYNYYVLAVLLFIIGVFLMYPFLYVIEKYIINREVSWQLKYGLIFICIFVFFVYGFCILNWTIF